MSDLSKLTVETRNLVMEAAASLFDRETHEALGDALEALTVELRDIEVRGWFYAGGVGHVMQRVASMLVDCARVGFRMERGASIAQPVFTRVIVDRADSLRRRGPVTNGDVAAAFLRQASILAEASCQGGAR